MTSPKLTRSLLADHQLARRGLLRSASASISLPFFASLKTSHASEDSPPQKRRLVCIGNMLGFHPPSFWPELGEAPKPIDASNGLSLHKDFQWGRTTASLANVKKQSTVISGLDHGLKGGHFAIHSFLSGVRQIDAKSMRDANVTVDQFAAMRLAGKTRFPTLTIGSQSGIHGGCQLSWTRSGTRVPPIPGPAELFRKLFVAASAEQRLGASAKFDLQESILDSVLDDANHLNRKLNADDRDKFDEYLTSIRDVERRIELKRGWVDVPKPKAPFETPQNRSLVKDLPLLYDLIVLALQTDSTRIATLEIGGDFNPRDLDVQGGYHALSHHGQRAESIESLVTIESYQIEQYVRFIRRLAEVSDENGPLLDQTNVLFGSGMGNANSHTNSNLPIILSGGGMSHGRWLEFDSDAIDRPPLTNLFVSLLQRMDLEVEQFATSTGTLRGLA